MESKATKKAFFIAIKIFVSGLLLTLILRKTGLQNIFSHFRLMDLRFFLFSAALHLLIVSLAALRWGLFLDHKYPPGKLLSLYFIGSFFNIMLPGAVGGDAVKVFYVYKDTQKGGSSFGSVFLDRFIGMIGLFTVGLASGLVAYQRLKAIGIHLVIPIVFVSFIAGSFLVFRFRIGRRFAAVGDFYEYFYRYLRKKKVLLKGLLLSVVIQVLSIASVYFIALGLNLKLPFMTLCVFVPIINTVTAIPISISGLGVRETAFVALLGLIGIAPEASTSISFLWFLSLATSSLVGLVEFLRFRVISLPHSEKVK